MFDRFKRNRPADDRADGRGNTAVAERPTDERADDDRHHGRGKEVAAGAAGAAAGAAVEHHHERKQEQRAAGGDGVADDRTRVDDGDRGHGREIAAGAAGAAGGAALEHHHERKVQRRAATDGRTRQGAPVVGAEGLATMHERQRARYGGASWGAAFFGLLSAVGLAAILTGILTGAGAAIGISQIKNAANAGDKTIGLGGGILLLLVLAIAWYCGGYVAGRMARFDGTRQGFAVWVWTILFVALVAVGAVIGGNKYDVAGALHLPSIPTHDQTWTTGGAIAAVAALVVTLLFAVLGGKAGDRFHRRVDRIATDPYDEPVAA